jgi:hypothetical protein
MSKLLNIVKGARREAAAKAGAYDGRFGHRVIQDPRKEYERNLCRQEVEVPLEEEEEVALFDYEDVEGPTEYEEEVSFNPFASLA